MAIAIDMLNYWEALSVPWGIKSPIPRVLHRLMDALKAI
jgi:hypothetical protein